MKIDFGGHQVELGGPEVAEGLNESNDILGDPAALRERLAADGYLLIRGLQDREAVLAARKVILENMARDGVVDMDHPLMDGVISKDKTKRTRLEDENGQLLARHPAVLAVVESQAIFNFFQQFFGREPLTFTTKWLRAMGPGAAGGAHFDSVYVGGGSRNVITVWTPFGDLTPDQGTLALLTGSHNLPSYEKIRKTYGQSDVDKDEFGGTFCKDPLEIQKHFGGQWRTTEFRAGDVIMFGLLTMHKATTNTSDRWRISCDTRFQPADEPVDKRWGGPAPTGHYSRKGSATPDLAGALAKWKL